MFTSDELIGHHRNRPDYVESPANSLQLAYGGHKYVKYTYELLREPDVLKLKILRELNDDFKLSNNITLALLSSDILSVLVKHFAHQNAQIRQLCCLAAVQVCSTNLGREHISKKKHTDNIAKLYNDKVENIRANSYNALLNFTETQDTIEEVLQTNILEQLVDKLLQEKVPNILVKTLKLLKNLLHGEKGTGKVLKTECIKRLLNLLNHENAQIREWVCTNIACISYNEKGKADIVDKGGVPLLCKRLTDEVSNVRQAVTLCLCSLSQINSGKNQIIQSGSFDNIIKLLTDPSKDIKLNTVQLIANLAEHPQGQKKAVSCLPTLKGITDVEKIYIDATVDVINWKP